MRFDWFRFVSVGRQQCYCMLSTMPINYTINTGVSDSGTHDQYTTNIFDVEEFENKKQTKGIFNNSIINQVENRPRWKERFVKHLKWVTQRLPITYRIILTHHKKYSWNWIFCITRKKCLPLVLIFYCSFERNRTYSSFKAFLHFVLFHYLCTLSIY